MGFTSDQVDELRAIHNSAEFVVAMQELADVIAGLPEGDFCLNRLADELSELKREVRTVHEGQAVLRSGTVAGAADRLEPELRWREHRIERIEAALARRGPKHQRRALICTQWLKVIFEDFRLRVDHSNPQSDFVVVLGVVFNCAGIHSSAAYFAKHINRHEPDMPVPDGWSS